jgi:hypothetical protein
MKFEKGFVIAELLSEDFEMIGEEMPVTTVAEEYNKKARDFIRKYPEAAKQLVEQVK